MITPLEATLPSDRACRQHRILLMRGDGVSVEFVLPYEVVRYVPERISDFARAALARLKAKPRLENTCRAGRDGDCHWDGCPQNDPATRQSHCPRDIGCGRCGKLECEC